MARPTPTKPRASTPRGRLIASGTAIGIGAVIAGIALAPSASAVEPTSFADAVTAEGITAHLQALQDIADANDGNRAAGTSGYEASAQYVESTLIAAGYTPTRQEFDTWVYTPESYALTLSTGAAVEAGIPMSFSPSTAVGGVTGTLVTPASDPLACTADAWDGVDLTGSIAVVSRGTCSFAEKSIAAGAAGAAAVFIYNNSEVGSEELNGTLGQPDPGLIPSVGFTADEGAAMLAALELGPVEGTVDIQGESEFIETFNIIAETSTGRDDNVVMLGSHLDSVPEGPGINDNGSGSAALLETAVQLTATGDVNNKVRFAWWGAEEVGLVGSYFYTDELSEEDAGKIATYLNFDMVASPNYVISVYDADESTYPAPDGLVIPEGSIATEAAFTDYFDSIGQPWIDTAFDGRSDYDGFISAGIPASGVFTGADDVKTADEVALFGGTAGITHDPNYHSVGDDIANINQEALGITSKAIAFVTASFAMDTSAINGVLPPVTPTPTPTVTPTVTPTTTPTATPVPTATAAPVPTHRSTAAPVLAATGTDAGLPLGLAGFLIAGGVGALLLTTLRARRARR